MVLLFADAMADAGEVAGLRAEVANLKAQVSCSCATNATRLAHSLQGEACVSVRGMLNVCVCVCVCVCACVCVVFHLRKYSQGGLLCVPAIGVHTTMRCIRASRHVLHESDSVSTLQDCVCVPRELSSSDAGGLSSCTHAPPRNLKNECARQRAGGACMGATHGRTDDHKLITP